jgi:hypothetical protein
MQSASTHAPTGSCHRLHNRLLMNLCQLVDPATYAAHGMDTAAQKSPAASGASATRVPINCDATHQQLIPPGEPLMTQTADTTPC